MITPTLRQSLEQCVTAWKIEMRGWQKAMEVCPAAGESYARMAVIHKTLKACVEDIEILLKADEVRK